MIVLKNGRFINPATNTNKITDVVIDHGIIQLIASKVDYIQATQFDATGMIIAPGLIDTHAHFRTPGYTHKEDIKTGSNAAARGGYTSVVLMANTDPPVDNADVLRLVLDECKKSNINLYSCATATIKMLGEEVVDMAHLARAGAVGFTDDGVPITDVDVLKQAIKEAWKAERPISLHEENPYYIKNAGINRGYASDTLKCRGACRKAEISMIKRDVDIAQRTGAKVVIQHVSTKEGVQLIREAKEYNPLLYAEATPHHFSLTEEALITKGVNAKVNPPLRTEEDRLAIIEGLQNGALDIIATDHAPHTAAEKNEKMTLAPSGMIGLETALSLAIKELVNPGYLTYLELFRKMCVNPAELYGLQAGNIAENKCADLVVFHPEETWKVGDFLSKSRNSPFVGEILPGVVYLTICKGKIVYWKEGADDKIIQRETTHNYSY